MTRFNRYTYVFSRQKDNDHVLDIPLEVYCKSHESVSEVT